MNFIYSLYLLICLSLWQKTAFSPAAWQEFTPQGDYNGSQHCNLLNYTVNTVVDELSFVNYLYRMVAMESVQANSAPARSSYPITQCVLLSLQCFLYSISSEMSVLLTSICFMPLHTKLYLFTVLSLRMLMGQ